MTTPSTGDTDDAGDTDDSIVYDLTDWDDDQVDLWEWQLGREGVPCRVEDRQLVVHGDDEGRVDHIIENLVDGGDEPEDDDEPDGDDAPEDDDELGDTGDIEALGDLFVAADRLMTADDGVTRGALQEAAARNDGLGLPYGFELHVWERIRVMAMWLSDELDGGADDLLVADHAKALRDLLRQYV
jgi:hypothetical protein